MKNIDPRAIFFIAACFSTLGVLIEKTWLLFAVFVIIIIFNVFLSTELLILVKRIKGLILLVLFVAILESLFNGSGKVLLTLGSFNIITSEGILRGLNLLLRMACVIASGALFTISTPRKIIEGIIKMKIPYEIAFMTIIALKFLPIFRNEFVDVFTAIQLRGVNFKKVSLGEKSKIISGLIMPVTYSAIDKSQKLSIAMELRAFRAFPDRTSIITLKMRLKDYFYMIFVFFLTLFLLLFYYGVIF